MLSSAGPGDDQRRARLVDQDRVHLVDDGEGQAALHAILEAVGEVVAQVVEAELVVGAVGDVAGVGGALLRRVLRVLDHPDGEAQEAVDRAHPVRIALRQVLVDRDDVHALAAQRVQVGRQRRHEGLALAGAHLGDLALVQGDAADQLHVEVAHLEGAARRLAHHRKGLRQQLIEARAGFSRSRNSSVLARSCSSVSALIAVFELVGGAHIAAIALDEPLIAAAENTREEFAAKRDSIGKNELRDNHLP